MADVQDHAAFVLDKLTRLHPKLIDLGLERTIALSQKCDSPHEKLPPVIHIAGTNGKGSVSAFLHSMAQAAGLSVHVYTSPHLCRFNERIRLNGYLISDPELIDVLNHVEQANADAPLTFFEATTVAALLAFSHHPADLLILETGLGGVFDSTNIIADTLCSIITPIAFDHEQFLGRDIATIARQKAGIMRAGRPTIWAEQTPDAHAELIRHAESLGCVVYEQGKKFQLSRTKNAGLVLTAGAQKITTPPLSLHGAHQAQNAALALMALKTTKLVANIKTAAKGAGTAVWPGRVQKLPEGKLTRLVQKAIWLDGAHNVHGALALRACLGELDERKWTVVFGALNTRPADAFLSVLKPITNHIYCLTIPDQPAAMSADELVAIAKKTGLKAQKADSIFCACKAIADESPADSGPIIICGSLYLAGEVLQQNATLPE